MIYISHGIPKSASSFVYQIVGAAAKIHASKINKPITNLKELFGVSNIGFAEISMRALELPINPDGLCQLVEIIEEKFQTQGEGVIVLKTHLACSEKLSNKISAGQVIASSCFRHPADMLLSRIDMLDRIGENISYEKVKANYIKNLIPSFMTWANNHNVVKFYFADIVNNADFIASQVANQFKLNVKPEILIDELLADKSKIIEFNKGVIDRYKTELSTSEIKEIEIEFSDYIGFIRNYRNTTKTSFIFAIITPTFNSLKTIDETILSVVSQKGDFHIRYHIQDGGSDDGTIEKLIAWKNLLSSDISSVITGAKEIDFTFSTESDDGVYDALNKGFSQIEGDMYTWVGSDDILSSGALCSVMSLIEEDPFIDWVTGTVSLMSENGSICNATGSPINKANYFPKEAISSGFADGNTLPIIQQEGTFWSEILWNKVGKRLRSDLYLAGDFELWTRMAQYAELVTVISELGIFRARKGQLSSDTDGYTKEVREIQKELKSENTYKVLKSLSDGNLTTRSAAMLWPTAEWKFDYHVIKTSNKNWTALQGVGYEEGPFPEQELKSKFYWLIGEKVVLDIFPENLSEKQRVKIVLRNFQHGQKLFLKSGEIEKEFKIPVSTRWRRDFKFSFDAKIPPSGKAIELLFSKSASVSGDERSLTAILLSIDVKAIA